jgi:hypothetical protein
MSAAGDPSADRLDVVGTTPGDENVRQPPALRPVFDVKARQA